MKLEEYLEALKNCPDELTEEGWRLTTEFGVYDNYPILLNVGFKKLLSDLEEIDFTLCDRDNNCCHLNYNPGTVLLQTKKIHSKRKQFKVDISLHTYQKKEIPEVHWTRALVDVISKIGNYAIRENISLCFPTSPGTKRLKLKDYSQTVYFP